MPVLDTRNQNLTLDFADTRAQSHTRGRNEDPRTQNVQLFSIPIYKDSKMSTNSNTRALNRTLNGDTINTSLVLSSKRSRRTMAPTRPNQRLSISADGTITTHTRTFESELRSMFSRLGAELSNERRNGRFINPITNRAITIRDNTDIRRLERRMLARSRFNAARTPPAPPAPRLTFTEVQQSAEYNFGVYSYITPSDTPRLGSALRAIEAQNGGRRIDRARIMSQYGDGNLVQTKILEFPANEIRTHSMISSLVSRPALGSSRSASCWKRAWPMSKSQFMRLERLRAKELCARGLAKYLNTRGRCRVFR